MNVKNIRYPQWILLSCIPSLYLVVVEDLGFTTLLTSQFISVAFYKFCSEALISLEVLLCAINLRHRTHSFTSLLKEVILRIFYALKKSTNLRSHAPALSNLILLHYMPILHSYSSIAVILK